MVSAGDLVLGVRPDLAGLQSQLTAAMGPIGASASRSLSAGLSAGLKKAGTSLTSAGRTLTRTVSLPLIGIGAIATKMALDYDQAFTQIEATTNASQETIDGWRKSVLALSGVTARSPEELANALYFLASAGLDAKEIFPALEASAKAAASGLGETQDIAKITANVLNAYADAGLKAADVTDTLVAAVREGTADPKEFSGALGRIIPIASKAGVSFDQVAASLATVSNIGLDVNEGVTAMRGLLQALVAPTQQTQDALKKLGLSSDDVRASLADDGLLDTLDLLDEKSHGQIETIQQLVPNVRSLTGFFGLQGQEAEKVDAIFAKLADSTGALGDAFKTTRESDAFKFQQGMNDLRIAAIKLGNQLIPILVDTIIPAIQDALKWWQKLSPESKTLALKLAGLAILAGPMLRLGGGLLSVAGGLAKFVPWILKLGSSAGTAGIANLATAGAGAAAGAAPAATGLLGPNGLPISSAPAAPLVGPEALGGGAALSAAGSFGLFAVAINDARRVYDGWKDNGVIGGIAAQVGNLQEALAATNIIAGGALSPLQQFLESMGDTSDVGSFTEGIAKVRTALLHGKIDIGEATGVVQELADQFKVGLPDGAHAFAQGIAIAGDGMKHDLVPILHDATTLTDKERTKIVDLANQFTYLGGHLDKNTKAQLRNVTAMGDGGAAARIFRGEITKLRGAHQKAKGAADEETSAVGDLASGMQHIPPVLNTTFKTPGLAEANRGVDDLAAGLNGLPSTKVINIQLNREQWPGHAAGGPVAPDQPYIVGEHGPEMFVSSTPGRIVANEHLRKSKDGGTTRLVLLEGKVDIDSGQVRLLARDEIDGENRYRGTRARASR